MARANPNLFEQAVAAGKGIKASDRFKIGPKTHAMMLAGDLQGVLDQLTSHQKSFITEFLKDENMTKAYIRAGGKSKYPNKMGSDMYYNPKIRFCIDGLKAERAEYTSVTDDYIIKKIVSVIDKIEGADKYDAQAILRAAELLGRANGIFRDRQEISGPNGGPIETKDIEDNASAFDTLMDRLKERAEKEKTDESEPGTDTRRTA